MQTGKTVQMKYYFQAYTGKIPFLHPAQLSYTLLDKHSHTRPDSLLPALPLKNSTLRSHEFSLHLLILSAHRPLHISVYLYPDNEYKINRYNPSATAANSHLPLALKRQENYQKRHRPPKKYEQLL